MNKFWPIAVATGLAVALMPAIASAKAAPNTSTAKVAPAIAPAAQASLDKACTLSPSLSHSGGDFASCISVGATLSSVPSVGQTATLTIRVKAARSEPNTQVTVDLPATFTLSGALSSHSAITGTGSVTRASIATLALAAGQTTTLTRTVRAVGSGFGAITATAKNQVSKDRVDAGTDSVYVTTGATAATTFSGGGTAATATTAKATVSSSMKRAGPARVQTTPLHQAPVTVAGIAKPGVIKPNTAGTSCATGTWNYQDQTGASRPGSNTLVEVLDSSNNLLSYAVSGNGTGAYTICWSTGGATTNVYVKFLESNNIWRVTDENGNVYGFSTPITAVPDGTTQNFGNLYPGSSSYDPGLHAFDIANDDWNWVHGYFSGQCWSPYETSCQQLTIHWQSDSTTGTYWNTSGVYLLAGSPDTVDEPAHEIGHDIMYELYSNNFPATTNCSPHYLFVASSTTCGWTEGWADWVATSVYNNTVWTFNGGGTQDFNVTWNEGLGYDTGDQVEGRIVQAMRSLTDGVKYPFDNDSGEGGGIRDNTRWFAVLNTYRPNTFADVWNDRAAAGYDTSQTALSALYQGTIDYGFRNPLSDYVGKQMPEAVPNHNYSHTTTTSYWSVVAEKPNAGTDTDLYLYNDFGLTSLLSESDYGGTTTDFVAINSNSGHRALQTYYPVVNQFTGSGGYTIEEAQGTNSLSAGLSTVTMGSAQPVRVWDSYQTAGVPVYYRAVPDSGVDVQLAALPAANDILSRGSSIQGTDPGTAGTAATVSYTPSDTGWAGLVLLNNSLSTGNVTVYADTSAATGTVSINGGAASTTSANVSLTLSATDAQTGVFAKQISTDGVFDTEPVTAYSTSASVTLPGANGTKTVYVRYENNAGMWSTPVTDTITLSAPPTVTALSPTSGTTSGGTSVTVTGTHFTGATAVKFGTVAATSFTVNSDTSITAVSPAQPAAGHYVYVTTPQGTSAGTAASRYTYVTPPPAVTSISPTSGTTAGGTTVTLTGTNFTGASAVKFGTVAATSFTVVSATKITAVSPAQAAGGHYIYVTTPTGTSAGTAANRFTYAGAPTVTALSPTGGTTAGGTTVTLTGTNFTGATVVKFGAVAATSFTVVSATKITAVSPAQAAGGHYIYVTTPSGTSAGTAANRYTYGAAPTVTALSPTGGTTAGGTTVTLTGTNFTGATVVKFGTVNATSFTVVSATKITAVSPAEPAGGHYVYVTTPVGISAGTAANRYTFS